MRWIVLALLFSCGGTGHDCPDLTWGPRAGWATFHCSCGDRAVKWSDVTSCEESRTLCAAECRP